MLTFYSSFCFSRVFCVCTPCSFFPKLDKSTTAVVPVSLKGFSSFVRALSKCQQLGTKTQQNKPNKKIVPGTSCLAEDRACKAKNPYIRVANIWGLWPLREGKQQAKHRYIPGGVYKAPLRDEGACLPGATQVETHKD